MFVFCQLQIVFMQRFHFGQEAGEIMLVVDDVIRNRQALGAVSLCGQNPVGQFGRSAITLDQPLVLDFTGAIHHQHPVKTMCGTGFDQQGHDVNLIGRRGMLLGQLLLSNADGGMQHAFEISPGIGIVKHAVTHSAAIKLLVGIQYVGTKMCDQLRQCRLAWFDHFAGKEVGVDNGRAQTGKFIGHHALATGNTAREGDAQGGNRFQCWSMFRYHDAI